MSRFHLRAFALVVLSLCASRAAAQDAATAQKALAGGTALQQRLRVDSLANAGGKLAVSGVFLNSLAAKADEPAPFDAMTAEAETLLRKLLKDDGLKFDWSGVAKVEPKDHPHVALQQAANAAGEDRVRLDASRFGPDGALVLVGLRAKDDATAKWLAGAVTKHLTKHPAVKLANGKPLVTDEVKAVEWKLAPGDVQALFAASKDAATRRLRVDRVSLGYDGAALQLTLAGVRLGEDAVDAEAIPGLLRRHWPELFTGGPKVLVNAKPLLGPGVPDLHAKLQEAVAAKPALDGVRVDPGAEFGANGVLMLAGLRPDAEGWTDKELVEAYRAVLKEFIDKGDAAAERYKRLAAGAVSAANMQVGATGKLLAELRAWAAATADDVRPTRLHFAADGRLTLQATTATKPDGAALDKKFKELAAKLLPAAPTRPAPAAELGTFDASLTAHLRKELAGDQKKWAGVLIERGVFDATDRYTLRGVADTAAQNDELAKLFAALKADPKRAAFFAPAPNPPKLDVVPLTDLVARVQRVAPAYPAFDGVRIEAARYDADGNLIFEASAVGKLADAPAAKLAELIRADPMYKRRAPADRQVKVVRTTEVAAEVGLLNAADGAKLLVAGDDKKTKAWLDSALLHHPDESAAWFLSAYHHHAKGDAELVRRDLFRMIAVEGPPTFDGPPQRKRRYEAAKDLQGTTRAELDALVADYTREIKDGAKPLTLTKGK